MTEAGKLITAKEAERRVLILENPGLRVLYTTQPSHRQHFPVSLRHQRLTQRKVVLGTLELPGHLWVAQTSYTSPVAVVEPDDFAVSGKRNERSGAVYSGYARVYNITVEVTANASGNTITLK